MKAEGLLRSLVSAHQAVYQRTDGRIGHRLFIRPTLLLTTQGRRTGTPRTAGLVYGTDGADYLVVASNWGTERLPGWVHNLRAGGPAEVQVGRRRVPVTFREVLPEDEDHSRLWDIVNRVNRDLYRRYAKTLKRPLAVIALTPTDSRG